MTCRITKLFLKAAIFLLLPVELWLRLFLQILQTVSWEKHHEHLCFCFQIISNISKSYIHCHNGWRFLGIKYKVLYFRPLPSDSLRLFLTSQLIHHTCRILRIWRKDFQKEEVRNIEGLLSAIFTCFPYWSSELWTETFHFSNFIDYHNLAKSNYNYSVS